MSRSIIILPDDSAQPILDAIAKAAKSIRVKMFLFSDPSLMQAVIAAQNRGVHVRVMLNPERRTVRRRMQSLARPSPMAVFTSSTVIRTSISRMRSRW